MANLRWFSMAALGVVLTSAPVVAQAQAESGSNDAGSALPSAQELQVTPAAPVAVPAPSAPVADELPAVTISAPKAVQLERYSPIAAPATASSPNAGAAISSPTISPGRSLIDKTDYSVGATRSYDAPSLVILSERQSGCQASYTTGQGVMAGVCGGAIASSSVSGRFYGNGYGGGNAYANYHGGFPVSALGATGNGYAASFDPAMRPKGLPGNGNLRLMFPLSIPAEITSVFGWRLHPISGTWRFHSGTDIGAPLGTPVLAAFSGRVSMADWLGGYGLTIVLSHNKGTQETLYGHLSAIYVQPGQWVDQGSAIGLVGSTGNSTGPHLHFEVRRLTPDGWVALDAGASLETAVAQLIESLRVAKLIPAQTNQS